MLHGRELISQVKTKRSCIARAIVSSLDQYVNMILSISNAIESINFFFFFLFFCEHVVCLTIYC